jgi:flagellar M-ring protein FliF
MAGASTVSSVSGGVKRTLAGFTSGQKTVTALAVVFLVVGGFMFTKWAAKPALVPVFTNLSSADASAVTDELNSKGVKYELAEGGSTVLVPQAEVYQLRLDLSAAGLPKTGTAGYELLDKQGITTSEFRQRVDYQRALEGELSKTVSSIEGVDSTIVHIVIPEENLFSEDTRKPSASVLIKTRQGKPLGANQVQTVVNLVSSSVEGMTPERVAVSDAAGNVLSATGPDGQSAAAGDARTAQTGTFEKALQTSIQDMLAPITGPGKAVVRVKADLDFDAKETQTETFETDKKAPVVTETTGGEKFTGTGQVVGGVLGPENVQPAPGAGSNSYDKAQASRTYAVGKVTEKAKAAPGKVNRLSVAVVLDESAKTADADAVKKLVAAAAGIDTTRGDVVEVSTLAFDKTAAEDAAKEFAAIEAAKKHDATMSLVRTGVVALIVLLILIYAMRSMRKDRREPVAIPGTLTVEQMQQLATAKDMIALQGARAALEPASTPEQLTKQAIREDIEQMVSSQPDEVATLLRSWLSEPVA